MIEVRIFEMTDLLEIQPSKVFRSEQAFLNTRSQFGHTILIDGKPVAAMGGNVIWPGVAEVWAFMSDDIRKNPLGVTRIARDLLSSYEGAQHLHRMQCYVRPDFPMAVRWAETLGFVREGLLRKIGHDGTDQWLMGRVS